MDLAKFGPISTTSAPSVSGLFVCTGRKHGWTPRWRCSPCPPPGSPRNRRRSRRALAEAQPGFFDGRDPRDVVQHEARISGALLVQRQILLHRPSRNCQRRCRDTESCDADPLQALKALGLRQLVELRRGHGSEGVNRPRICLEMLVQRLCPIRPLHHPLESFAELVVRFHNIGGVIDLPLEENRPHVCEKTIDRLLVPLVVFQVHLELVSGAVTVTSLAGRSRGVISPRNASRVAVPPSRPPGSVSLRSLVRKRAAILRTGGTRSPGFVPG